MLNFNWLADSNNPYAKTALNITSGLALFCAAAWGSYTLFAAKDAEQPPRVVNSITLEPTVLLAGKPYVAHINVTLNRLCPYEVHWSLVRKTDNVEVVKIVEPIKAAPAALGTQDLPDAKRYIPYSVDPGDYKYISEVFDLCPDGHTYTSVRRNVDITVR